MLDVDHFKSLNESHGHLGGDVLLRELAALLSTSVHVEDIVCRYGGEEFCLVLPNADTGILQERAEMIRRKAKELRT